MLGRLLPGDGVQGRRRPSASSLSVQREVEVVRQMALGCELRLLSWLDECRGNLVADRKRSEVPDLERRYVPYSVLLEAV